MERLVLVLMASLALGGCGLGEATVAGTAAAKQAKEGLATEERVKQQLDAAAALDAQRREEAETSAQ